MIVAPSLLNAGIYDLENTLEDLEKAGAKYLHIDVMDGHFVPNMAFGPSIIKDLKKMTDMVLDVHLMVDEPEKVVEEFLKEGSDIVTVHCESTNHLYHAIQLIKKNNGKAGVAINPATPICMIENALEFVDQVLVMTINPGRNGQKFIPGTLKKIAELSMIKERENLHFDIQVDGNISNENVKDVIKAGANIVVSGGYIFNGDNVEERIKNLLEG